MSSSGKSREAILDHLVQYVRENNLGSGDRIPAIRDLAKMLGIGHVTMARAISNLAEEGVLSTNRKGGTRLTESFPFSIPAFSFHTVVLVRPTDYHQHDSTIFDDNERYRRILRGISTHVHNPEVFFHWVDYDNLERNLSNMADYFSGPISRGNITFVLFQCKVEIKEFFQKNGLPAVIVGGAEEGIHLPSVSVNRENVIDQIKKLLDHCDAYPAAHLTISEIGDQAYYQESFKRMNAAPGKSHNRVQILKLTHLPDMKNAQVKTILSAQNRPATIIMAGHIETLVLLEFCRSLGIDVPGDVRILTLDLGLSYLPMHSNITGFLHDYHEMGEHVGSLIAMRLANKNIQGVRLQSTPVLSYNETFPLPV